MKSIPRWADNVFRLTDVALVDATAYLADELGRRFGVDLGQIERVDDQASAVAALGALRADVSETAFYGLVAELAVSMADGRPDLVDLSEGLLHRAATALWGRCCGLAKGVVDFDDIALAAMLDAPRATAAPPPRGGPPRRSPPSTTILREPEFWSQQHTGAVSDWHLDEALESPASLPRRRHATIVPDVSPWGGRFVVAGLSFLDRRAAPRRLQGCELVISLSRGWLGRSGLEGGTATVGLRDGTWRLPHGEAAPSSAQSTALMLLAQAKARPSNWYASLLVDGPLQRVRVPTDAVGARELFATRDKAPGAQRRAALLHWVSSHRRRNPATRGDHGVAQHLRGATRFSWNGIDVVLEPSEYDREVVLGKGARRGGAAA